MEALESAAMFEEGAATREDWVYVEQLYWRAYNVLRESDDAESRFQRSFCLERIADILESEGRAAEAARLRKKTARLTHSFKQG